MLFDIVVISPIKLSFDPIMYMSQILTFEWLAYSCIWLNLLIIVSLLIKDFATTRFTSFRRCSDTFILFYFFPFPSLQATSKKVITREEWEKKLNDVRIRKEDMNKLVMNFLVTEGYVEAAEKFRKESGTDRILL